VPASSYCFGDEELPVEYRMRRGGDFDAGGRVARVHGGGAGWIDLEVDGLRQVFHVLSDGSRTWVQGPRGDVCLQHQRRCSKEADEATAADSLRAPMPGEVVAVKVRPGDEVSAGTLLLVLEAMKMEHRVAASRSGRVREVRARAGDQVRGGDVLVVLDES
jgi:propionyl-CoA carboxylase alpha chain